MISKEVEAQDLDNPRDNPTIQIHRLDTMMNLVREHNKSFQVNHSDSSPSLDDTRIEMKWGDTQEELLIEWKQDTIIKSKKHSKKRQLYKFIYVLLNIPATICPMIISVLETYYSDSVSIPIMMIISGMLIGTSTFINAGSLTKQYEYYSNQYQNLSLMIEMELNKPKKNRVECDIFLERIYREIKALNEHAPDI